MDNNSKFFYISGFLSLGLFSLFSTLFIVMMFKKSDIQSYALKKDNFISISLVTPKIQTHKRKKVQKSSPVVEPVSTPSKNVDINNLFSDVWTKKIVHKKEKIKPVNQKRLLAIQKQLKTSKENDVKSISKTVENLESVKTNEQSDASSTAQEVNEYLAKIQAIVYKYFHVPPNSEGSSVKTVIELNSLGKVIDFRVLSYSNNSAMNNEVDRIKTRLLNVIFPKNPQNRSSRTIVILISKE